LSIILCSWYIIAYQCFKSCKIEDKRVSDNHTYYEPIQCFSTGGPQLASGRAGLNVRQTRQSAWSLRGKRGLRRSKIRKKAPWKLKMKSQWAYETWIEENKSHKKFWLRKWKKSSPKRTLIWPWLVGLGQLLMGLQSCHFTKLSF